MIFISENHLHGIQFYEPTKSLRLSDAIKSAGICVDILSPTVILLHLLTTCWFVTKCLNLLT